jgi:hypothetical protein
LFHRFHLLVALAFAGFPFFAISWAASLLENLFVLSPFGLATVAALAQLLGHTLVAVTWTSTRNGPLRLWPGLESPAAEDATRLGFREFRNAFRRAWGTSPRWTQRLAAAAPALALALALPTLAIAFLRSGPEFAGAGSASSAWVRLAALAAGVAGTELLRLLAGVVTAWLTPPETGHGFASASRAGRALAAFGSAHTPRFARRLRELLTALLARSPFGPGYVWVDPQGRRFLHTGHLAAMGLFALTALVYVAVGILQRPSGQTMGDPSLPALGAVLLALTMVAWALPGLSFLLDRFRVPVLPAVLVVSAALYAIFGADHYFALRRPVETLPQVAGADLAVVDGWFSPGAGGSAPRPNFPIIAVAAAGGGITSSAWTAAALSGLASGESGGEFLASLKLISGASGGSVGAMFFLDRLPDAPLATMGPLAPERAEAIRRAASATSLASVGWGLAYPDLLRVLFSFPVATFWPEVDRSWALEASWRQRLSQGSSLPTLAGWRRATLAGRKPLLILNASSVETGERFELATLALDATPPNTGPRSFFSTFAGWDVDIVTAARLSASFPFVSLAARARAADGPPPYDLPAPHFADGGYTENSGVLSALEVLDAALSRHCPAASPCTSASVPPIILLRLRPFDPEARKLEDARSGFAWLTAGLSPIETLLAVREASQNERITLDLALFEAKWQTRGVKIEIIDLPLGGLGPLSWKLTEVERERIWGAWARTDGGEAVRRFRDELRPQ